MKGNFKEPKIPTIYISGPKPINVSLPPNVGSGGGNHFVNWTGGNSGSFGIGNISNSFIPSNIIPDVHGVSIPKNVGALDKLKSHDGKDIVIHTPLENPVDKLKKEINQKYSNKALDYTGIKGGSCFDGCNASMYTFFYNIYDITNFNQTHKGSNVLTNIRVISFSDTNMQDNDLKTFSRLIEKCNLFLDGLFLHNNNITGKGFSEFIGSEIRLGNEKYFTHEISYIDFGNNNIDNANVTSISKKASVHKDAIETTINLKDNPGYSKGNFQWYKINK